jgi:predicted metal-dependent peptidase
VNGTRHVQTKLSAARTRLILEHPFVGALVMHLPLRPADPAWCRTFASDARAFYFNPDYIAGLDLAQAQFVLAHQALHCALGHFARRMHRSARRWDLACDHAVNLLLVSEGMKPAPGTLLQQDFRALSAEEIYPLIPPDTAQSTLDQHLGDEAAHGAPRVSASERELLESAWRSRAVAAAQHARRAGRLPTSWMRLVDALIQPAVPWRSLLARYMLSAAREDYSFARPSRREGEAILPRLSSREVDVYVALDTSGSIRADELSEFAGEIDALKAQISARVTLFACDERLDERAPWRFEAWEPTVLPEVLKGGSGTSFVPVFDWISGAHARPDVLVYFTDAEGDFPENAPDFPVVWVVKGRGPVPWGERIQLESH